DSLMSVNLANRLETVLGVRVPIARLIQGPSVEQFVDKVLTDLVVAGAGPSADTAPAATPQPVVRTSEVSGDGWIIPPRPHRPGRVRVGRAPHAGGPAAASRPGVRAPAPAGGLVAPAPRGRAARVHEPPSDRIEKFLDALVPRLEPSLARPAAFVGHCLGG